MTSPISDDLATARRQYDDDELDDAIDICAQLLTRAEITPADAAAAALICADRLSYAIERIENELYA